MTDAPKLLSREELERALASVCDCAHYPNLYGCPSCQALAHIDALESERDAQAAWIKRRTDSEQLAHDSERAISRELECRAYARGLEDAAKVADEHYARAPSISGDCVRTGGWEDASDAIAAAIRALKPGEAE